MENTGSKFEFMKPMLLKAGIPLALSITALVCAKIATTHSSSTSSQPQEDSQPEVNTQEDFQVEECIHPKESEDFEGWRNQIHELEVRELETEMRFLWFQELKEQENMLVLELARVELLGHEISLMEAEVQGLENMMLEYFKLVEELEKSKFENGFLTKKVNKLLKKVGERSKVICEQNLSIKDKEEKILENHEELWRREEIIKQLEDENRELQRIVDQIQEEKENLLKRLEFLENSALSTTKSKEAGVPMEDYKKVVEELEQIQKEREAEANELIFLRWSNACLRHEQPSNHEEEEEEEEEKKGGHEKKKGNVDGEHKLDGSGGSQTYTQVKRQKLLSKFKRWVEGRGKMKGKVDDEDKYYDSTNVKCFGRNSVSDWPEEDVHHPRKSSSSAL